MKRVNLTKTAIRALQEGETIADTEIKELHVRGGKTIKTFFWRRRVADSPLRHTLGRASDMSIMEARAKAQELNHRLLTSGTIEEPKPEKPETNPTIEEAISQALADSKAGKKLRKDWEWWIKHFMEWLKQHHPDTTLWRDVTRAIVREYIQSLNARGLAKNTIRLYTIPIRQTARFYGREYSETFSNFCDGLQIGGKAKKETPTVLLRDVLDFLKWCGTFKPEIVAGVVLQGLCGLRMTEALRLKWSNVNLEHGLIEITGDVKNSYSRRTIPMCETATATMREIRAKQGRAKVRSIDGFVVEDSHNEPETQLLSLRIRRAFRLWNASCNWTPKDLRNCIPTFGALSGRGGPMLEQYLGHAPNDVTGLHYVARMNQALPGERELLLENMSKLRRIICEPFQAEIDRILSEEQTKAGETLSGETL